MIKVSRKYRLQPLLIIKERARKAAEIKLAQALARLESSRRRLEELQKEKEAINTQRRESRLLLHRKMISGEAKVRDGSHRVNFLKKLEEEEKEKDHQIEVQNRVIVDCQTEVTRARRDYINAVKELRIMEKHKALWEKKLKQELDRIEEAEMDEMGNVIYQWRRVKDAAWIKEGRDV